MKVLNKVLLMFLIDWAITDLKIPIIFTLSPGFTKSTKSCFKIAWIDLGILPGGKSSGISCIIILCQSINKEFLDINLKSDCAFALHLLLIQNFGHLIFDVS